MFYVNDSVPRLLKIIFMVYVIGQWRITSVKEFKAKTTRNVPVAVSVIASDRIRTL